MEGVDVFIVACSLCGGEFTKKNSRHKFCSQLCRDRGRPSQNWKGGTHVGQGKATHGSASFYKRGCRCQICRGEQARRMREYAARRRAEGRPLHKSRPTMEVVCAGCDAVFEARLDMVRAGRGRFCSADCHDRFQLDPDGKRAKAREYARKFGPPGSVRRRAIRRARAAVSLTGGNRVFVQGPCAVCEQPFTGVGDAARYCSEKCREKNKRGDFGIRFLDRMWIYSRDEYECHLCGMHVDVTMDAVEPGSVTLDHVVPQSRGGGHEFENLRLAHRLCNSVRRDIPLDEFLTAEMVSELRARLGVSCVSC